LNYKKQNVTRVEEVILFSVRTITFW